MHFRSPRGAETDAAGFAFVRHSFTSSSFASRRQRVASAPRAERPAPPARARDPDGISPHRTDRRTPRPNTRWAPYLGNTEGTTFNNLPAQSTRMRLAIHGDWPALSRRLRRRGHQPGPP